jgi:hypothetical protein
MRDKVERSFSAVNGFFEIAIGVGAARSGDASSRLGRCRQKDEARQASWVTGKCGCAERSGAVRNA